MLIKKKIYIYNVDDNEPFVYTEWQEAVDAIYEDLDWYESIWGDEDEQAKDARIELERTLKLDKEWYGIYVYGRSLGFFVREVEFDVQTENTI